MDKFEKLKSEMQKTLPEKRFLHVVSVCEDACRMAEIFRLDKNTLLTAALLHDCTKPLEYSEHLAVCKKYSLPLTEHDLKSGEVLHAKTGALTAKYVFGENDEVYSLIYNHSTGKADMTTAEKIIFLSDFIEKTRTYDECKRAREKFYKRIESAKTPEEKLLSLDTSVYEVLDFTLAFLEKKGSYIHPDTVIARDYLKQMLFSKS